MPRVTLTLDQPFQEMTGLGWGTGKLAGALRFIDRDNKGAIVETGIPKGFWKVPTLGVLALQPRVLLLGDVSYSSSTSDAYQQSEVDVANNAGGTPALSFLQLAGGNTRQRASRGESFLTLLADAAKTAILAQIASTQKIVWRTKNMLLANEGWFCKVAPRRTFDGLNANAYVSFGFGQFYVLGVDLQGAATLYENVGNTASPKWIVRKRMDLASVGVKATEPWDLYVIPVGGRYLVFRFGNTRYRGTGFRLESYEDLRDFRFDVVNEGRGNRYDANLDQYVCLEPDKLDIAVNDNGTDYTFLPGKVRYPSGSYVAMLGNEPLPYPVPGQTPALEPRGYAAGYTSGGSGAMTMALQDEKGQAWSDASNQVCPVVTMSASSDGLYTPELWYYDARVAPTVQTPPWLPQDASADWQSIRFAKSIGSETCGCDVSLKDEARYYRLFRRGGPFRIAVDGNPIYDGYFHIRRPTLGPTIVHGEYSGRDMWERLKVNCGDFESLDGKTVGETIERLLNRCGFAGQISVEDDNLGGVTFGDFDEPQSLKLYNADTNVDDALRDIISRTSIQGVEGIRVRWNGSQWRAYMAQRQGIGDPQLILSSTDDLDLGDGRSLSGLTDQERWDEAILKITSNLEFDVNNPQFNSLYARCSSESGYSSAVVIPPPPKQIETTLTNDPSDSDAQAFEGRLRDKSLSAPEITATTKEELARQARFIYEDEMSRVLGAGVQAEWQPFVDADMECVLVGKDLATGDTVSFGVWLIEHVDVEIHHDDALIPNADAEFPRSWAWSGGYRLRWRRATTADFLVPMYGGALPPKSY